MSMLSVVEPRTGLPVRYDDWRDWRSRWDRRPMSLRARVNRCVWCWAFGALVVTPDGPAGIPCLSCGRVGEPLERRAAAR